VTEGLSRKAAAEFSFSSANYVSGNGLLRICQNMGKGTAVEMKGYEMILQDENHIHLLLETLLPLLLHYFVTLSVSLQNTVSNFGVGTALLLVSHY
jgi:hypothetical protein